MLMRNTIPLNLFNLECRQVNETLVEIVNHLRATIVNRFIEENFNINRKYVWTKYFK